ncbi:hypothetical protein COCCADRAFT_6106 [Bipolaris zeicola 26-R-13]|uniref:Uncharacterized protein n=1 Tax=Cochliobolus carbonum (strain 26-R-13) TaxID=930089 RepID=W6Y3C5_COCC2|nr:uncharacterized protein COCCADRAFT_6106 [Bipolaris zeicola 26-R-13]EUC32140.1 hypothetical protein COCCADRAFT_6106 [Bipolaris zeicola 26-R-13]
MGNAISDMLKEADEKKETDAKEELEILQEMINAVLDRFESEITEKFLNAEPTAKTEPADAVGGAIDAIFGAVTGGGTKEKLANGFKKVVGTALNQFLSNTEIGVTDTNNYFIYVHHDAIVRIDLRMWRWNFPSGGFKIVDKGVLGYIYCISVVDVGVLKIPEFVYLISEHAGDEENEVEHYCEQMGKIYAAARKKKLSEKAAITTK